MATTTRHPRTRPAPIGGWSLIVGGVAFGLFWGMAATSGDGDLPSIAGLAVHGVSILALLLGIGLLWISSRPGHVTISVGAVVSALGLIMLFPLLPLGLGLMAWGLARDGWAPTACRVLLAGSSSLFAVVIARQVQAGAAIAGEEGAPALTLGWIVWFEASIVLVAVGLILLGRARLRRG